MSYVKRVHELVRKIPEGKVSTYGEIAKLVGTDPRMIGWALHANKDSSCPCHRVVDRNGRLAPNFAFEGWREQRMRLLAEKVSFKDEMHVNLEKHRWQIK